MSDEISVFQNFLSFVSSLYEQNKTLVAFIGGAFTFGVPHVYKIYKFFSDRQALKDKTHEELIEEAHKSRALMRNAANVLSEILFKAKSGVYWTHNGGSIIFYLGKIERDVVSPAVDAAEEFYAAVCDSNSLSLKKLKKYKMRAKKMKHTNELALSGMQARLREYGVQAKLMGKVE